MSEFNRLNKTLLYTSQDCLGLDDTSAKHLFMADESYDEGGSRAKITRSAAADTIRKFVDTGKVQWPTAQPMRVIKAG